MSGAGPPSAGPPPAFGAVVPPANPAVERELRALVPEGVDYYVARLPVLGGTLKHRTEEYARHLPDSLRAFGALPLDAVYVACTGCYYLLDDAAAAELARACAASRSSPVVAPTAAIREAAESLGASSAALVSPYPRWLTDACVAYWSSAGLRVAEVVEVGAGSPYGVPTREVLDAVGRLSSAGDLILFTGTGMATIPAMRALRERNAVTVPMLSSNVAGVWKTLRGIGRLGEAATLRSIAPELLAASA